MMYLILILFSKVCYSRESVYIDQIGNYNNISIDQTAGYYATNSNINANVRDDNNEINISQNVSSGTQNVDVFLSGGHKNVSVTQQDGSHSAYISLSGTPVSLNLTQVGNVAQNYSISFNCATVGGCQPISVHQGN